MWQYLPSNPFTSLFDYVISKKSNIISQTPPNPSPVDLKDVQGDIILGLPKRAEDFIFFTIEDVSKFRRIVGSERFLDLITTTADVQESRRKLRELKSQNGAVQASLIPLAAVNIAFTQTGLFKLGISDKMADEPFEQGQLARAGHGPDSLGDRGQTVNDVFVPDWHKEFRREIHGIILVAGESEETINNTVEKLEGLLDRSIKTVHRVHAKVRPGAEKGHEHFGYLDGISQPAVIGIVEPLNGQQKIEPGVLLVGQSGDRSKDVRPSWTKNGSFLVYRHLEQFVPEFDKFKRDNAINPRELGVEQGAELLGARMVGRWKDGSPVELDPLKANPERAADPTKNNDFAFSKNKDGGLDQSRCPFAAHIRKTNPRSDVPNVKVAEHSIMRAGIPFGREVTESERRRKKTEHQRGLSFVCYQSSLTLGFEFQQKSWSNSVDFVVAGSGHDPIIGQNGNEDRTMKGFDPSSPDKNLQIKFDFVQSKGGAYFFAPSVTALRTKIGRS